MESLVQGTNDSSIVSKLSMVQRGYFEDEFLQYFVMKPTRRAPLINIGYFVRSLVVQTAVKYYLDSNYKQVLSLGAGFDTTYFRIVHNYEGVTHFEIDFVDVVKNKISCVQACDKLKQMLTNIQEIADPVGVTSDRYNIFAQDLSDVQMVERHLMKCGFDFEKPTIIFSECAITYMEENRSTELIRWSAHKFKNVVFLNYEQINPDDGFGQVMKRHFIKIQNPLKSLDTYKTPESQEERYLKCGWEHSRSVTAMVIFNRLLHHEKQRQIFNLEPFDEWEEWHLKCSHYTLSIAINGCCNYPQFLTKSQTKKGAEKHLNVETSTKIQINRFAHCSFVNKKKLFVLGGFGCQETRHGRIKELLIINLETETYQNVTLECTAVTDSLFSTCTVINNDCVVFYGGRTSPLKAINEKPHLIFFQGDEVKIKELNVKHNSPRARWRHSGSSLNGSLIVFGGRTSDLQVLGDCWKLNIVGTDEGLWEELLPIDIQPADRFSHATASNNNCMYLSGGLSNEFKPLGDVWKMELKALQEGTFAHWSKLTVEIKPRYGHTMHLVSNTLLFFGGVSTTVAQPVCTLLHLETLIFQEISLCVDFDKPYMFHNHTSELHEDNTIYILGGGGNCFSFGTFFNLVTLKINLVNLLPGLEM